MPLMEELADEGLPSFTFLQITSHTREGFLDKADEIEFMRSFEALVAGKNPHNLKLSAHFPENTEDFIPSLQMKEGLRELFKDYRFPDDHEVRGVDDITAHYAALSELFGFEVDVPEMMLYSKANELKERGEVDSAQEVLNYLIEAYPSSVNGHWGLANLHREQGNRELALEYYRKCLEIMPNMPPARHWIEKLEEQQ
jgi:tetratricopeptide (TPR) repeat protein